MLHVLSADGPCGPTTKYTITRDAVFTIPAELLEDADGRRAIGCFFVIEAYACRVTFGGTTPTFNTGILMNPGDSLFLRQWEWMNTLQATPVAEGENPIAHITMEY